MANQGALLPAIPERDWEALEQQLVEQFDEIIPVGASHGEIEILGPEDGDGDDTPKTPQPTTLRHISDKKSPLKVASVPPPFIPVRAQDVNFEVGHLSFRSLNCSIFVRIMQIVYWMISILPMSFQIDTHANPGIPPFTPSHCYACALSSVILYYPYK
jgi:hypothetical protein